MGRADSPLRNRLVFVVGARRSGTNWLQRILRAHPEVASLPSETYVFNMGIAPLAARFQHTNPGSPMMATMFAERDGFLDRVRDLLDGAFIDNLERLKPDARFLVERTPWHVYDLELIAKVYPDARVIHILRDGRAVARSLLAQSWGPQTMSDAAREWLSSVEAGQREGAEFGDRYREVVYERLLGDPAAEIDDLFGWLGLELAPATRDRLLLETRTEFNVDAGAPGVRADKWREGLSTRDIATFDRIAGAQQDALGYERSTGARRRDVLPSIAAPRRAVRKVARYAKDPRGEARTQVERWYARRQRTKLHANFAVVERFENALSGGRAEEAVELLSASARVRISDGHRPREARGPEGEELLRDVISSYSAGDPTWGQTHSSANVFTIVSVYDDEGARWSRTLVAILTEEAKISDLSIYRMRLADVSPEAGAVASPAGAPSQ
jgi:hypothetical protein